MFYNKIFYSNYFEIQIGKIKWIKYPPYNHKFLDLILQTWQTHTPLLPNCSNNDISFVCRGWKLQTRSINFCWNAEHKYLCKQERQYWGSTFYLRHINPKVGRLFLRLIDIYGA